MHSTYASDLHFMNLTLVWQNKNRIALFVHGIYYTKFYPSLENQSLLYQILDILSTWELTKFCFFPLETKQPGKTHNLRSISYFL